MNILVVEDNIKLAKNLTEYFLIDNHKVTTTNKGTQAIELIEDNAFDLIILDLNLAESSGEEVIIEIRKKGNIVPIIVLSAKDSKESIVSNILEGADDYITKPFSFEELDARIKAVNRRNTHLKDSRLPSKIDINKEIHIDFKKREVKKVGETIKLSPKEYYLIEYLAKNKGEVQNRLDILENVWGEHEDILFSQTVDVHIAYLRRKLGKDVIRTAPGGYIID